MIIKPQRFLSDSLMDSARKLPEKVVAVVEGTAHTYSELEDSALRLARALRDGGLRRGDRVAIYMDNTWSCIVSIYAVSLAGGVFFVTNPQTKADKLEYVLPSDKHLAGAEGCAGHVRNWEDALEGPGRESAARILFLLHQFHRIGKLDLPSHIYCIVERQQPSQPQATRSIGSQKELELAALLGSQDVYLLLGTFHNLVSTAIGHP